MWDYDPGTARLTASLSFGRDQIVPAWSFVPNPDTFIPEAVRTTDELDTYSGSMTWEQAIDPVLKTQVQIRVSDVTGRDVRFQGRNDWAWLVTESLTARAQVGGAIEDPDFEAWFVGLSLDYEFSPGWHAGLSARIYHDTGEFTTAGFNTAAPSLDSTELSASLAWKNVTTTVRVGVGIFDTDYGALSADNLFFSDLYDDREFVVGRFAISHQF